MNEYPFNRTLTRKKVARNAKEHIAMQKAKSAIQTHKGEKK